MENKIEEKRMSEEEVEIKRKSEEYKKILLSEDPELDSIFYEISHTVWNYDPKQNLYDEERRFLHKYSDRLNNKFYITKREYLLSEISDYPFNFKKSIQGPYNHYETITISCHAEEVSKEEENQIPGIKEKKDNITKLKELAKSDDKQLDYEGTLSIPELNINGITRRMILSKGIDPNSIEWNIDRKNYREEENKQNEINVSAKDIAQLDIEHGLSASEVGGFKKFINKIRGLFQGKGEK